VRRIWRERLPYPQGVPERSANRLLRTEESGWYHLVHDQVSQYDDSLETALLTRYRQSLPAITDVTLDSHDQFIKDDKV
jgi:hypothetical protein